MDHFEQAGANGFQVSRSASKSEGLHGEDKVKSACGLPLCEHSSARALILILILGLADPAAVEKLGYRALYDLLGFALRWRRTETDQTLHTHGAREHFEKMVSGGIRIGQPKSASHRPRFKKRREKHAAAAWP